jgi:hypothetical protein
MWMIVVIAVLVTAASRSPRSLPARATGPDVWHGPTALIWKNCPQVGDTGNASLPGTVKVEDCESACANITGCNVINFLPATVPAIGDRCQLRVSPHFSPFWEPVVFNSFNKQVVAHDTSRRRLVVVNEE